MAPTIASPNKSYNGKVAGVTFADGTAETDNEAAISYFRRHGYTIGETENGQVPNTEDTGDGETLFAPSDHTIEDVRAYLDRLDDSDPEKRDTEFVRVVEAEKAGKNRKTLIDSIEGVPAADSEPTE